MIRFATATATATGTATSVKKVFIVFLLYGVFSSLCHAENISQIYSLARENDPRFQASKLEFEAIAYGVEESFGGFLPTIAADYNKTNTKQNIISSANAVFAVGSTSYPQSYEAITLTQPIFRLSTWHQYYEAKASEREAAATFAAAQQDLIMRTITGYMDVLAARNTFNFAQAEQDSIASQLALEKNKFSSGQATKVSLLDAEARAALKKSDVIAAQYQLDDKLQALHEIVGTQTTELVPLAEKFPLIHPEPLDIEKWVASSMIKNLTVESSIQAIEAAHEEMSKQYAAYYPTLDLAYDITRQDTGGSLFGGGSNVQQSDIALRLHIPIYNGSTGAITSAAAKRYEESKENLERVKRQVERQARAAYQGIEGGIQRIDALSLTVSSLESARDLKEEGYRAGLITVLGVLDAERDLYAAKRDFSQARFDYILNTLRLKQAAGTLSDEDVSIIGRETQSSN